ncbi:MAG TPA: hypothetical protein EYP30_09040 [Archaeoglobaceae archaeon]|nr:hypothetical protein [Archaeoglobaceae archaeon]
MFLSYAALNGLTLVRKVIEKAGMKYTDRFGNRTIGEEILEPTRIYTEVLDILKDSEVHGIAHITGGGLLNLQRLKKVKYVITDPLPAQKIFSFIQELGNVDEDEMYRTFNMGMGFAVILPEDEAESIKKRIDGRVVGHVEDGEGVFLKDLKL